MRPGHRFATRVFLIAGIYGLLVVLPQYSLEGRIARDFPPAITHPEYFYGFIGVALAWQVAFLIIASDVRRYRPLMLAAILEKVTFGMAAVPLPCHFAAPLHAGNTLRQRTLRAARRPRQTGKCLAGPTDHPGEAFSRAVERFAEQHVSGA